MSSDDELASVRVEVGDGGVSPEAPQVATPSGGPPKWVFGLGVVVLVAVVLAFVFLRPSDDVAADGSERVTPTTTIPVEDLADEVAAEESETADSTDPSAALVEAVAIDGHDGFFQIVEADIGFLALGSDFGSLTPPLWRSVNGVDWIEVESRLAGLDATEPTGANSDTFNTFWFGLLATDSGFLVSGDVPSLGEDGFSTFESTNGVDWALVDEAGPPRDAEFFFRIAGTSEFVTYTEFLGELDVVQVVEEHTSLDLDGMTVCGAFLNRNEEVEISGCLDGVVMLTRDDVVSPLPPERILECVSSLGERNQVISRSVRVDQQTGAAEVYPDSQAPWTFFVGQVVRADGTIASVDFRGSDAGDFIGGSGESASIACEDVIDLGEPTAEAAVLILDPETLTTTRVPLTADVDLPQLPQFAINAVGEVVSPNGEWLIISVGADLWAVDVESGDWVQLASDPSTGFGDSAAGFVLSASGERAYRVDGDITILEIAVDSDGMISATEIVEPIDTGGPEVLEFGDLPFATDDVVFFLEFGTSGQTLWSIDVSRVVTE